MRFVPILSFLLLVQGNATPPAPSSVQMKIGERQNLSLHFEADPERRYRVDVSTDLSSWKEHYISPFQERGDGLWVRQLGEYIPPQEFYRVSVLPFRFQSLPTLGHWVGDASMVLTPDGRAAFAFQDRETNELHFGEFPENGDIPVLQKIIGTGAEDEPDFWDNSGYTDVTLQMSPDGIAFVVCAEDLSGAIVVLWKPQGAEVWKRSVIRDGLSRPFWSFPKFAISSQGVMGVIYAGDDGSYYSWTSVTDPEHWNHVRFSTFLPSNASKNGLVFNDLGDVIVQAAENWWYRIDGKTREAASIWVNGQPQSRRGADGSLVALERYRNGTAILRSLDGGESWTRRYVEHQGQDEFCMSVDCNAKGSLSVFCPPSLYRETAPGGPWERTVMGGREYTTHITNRQGKIQLFFVNGAVSLTSED